MPQQSSRGEGDIFRAIELGIRAFALVFVGLVVAYLWQFGGKGLSPLQEHWGQFGDYLGGVLNPLLGYASVVLLALTLHAQHKVLEETRRQSVLQELQRMLSSIGEQLDVVLHRPVDPNGDLFAYWIRNRGLVPLPNGPLPTPTLLDVLNRACERLQDQRLDFFALDRIASAWEMAAVHTGMLRLDECLGEFLAKGGDAVLPKLYGSQYRAPAIILSALETLKYYPPTVRDYPIEAVERLGLAEARKRCEPGMTRISIELDRLIADSLDEARGSQEVAPEDSAPGDAGPGDE